MVNFYAKRKIYYIISAVLILAGIIGTIVNGVKLDITFSGGAKITYSYTGAEINATEVEALVKDTLGRDATVQNATGYQTDDMSLVISLAGTKSLTTEEQESLYKALNKAPQQTLSPPWAAASLPAASLQSAWLLYSLSFT